MQVLNIGEKQKSPKRLSKIIIMFKGLNNIFFKQIRPSFRKMYIDIYGLVLFIFSYFDFQSLRRFLNIAEKMKIMDVNLRNKHF